jgi:L-ascorbate metabolism protein UlaG (beta-lactamase superfamily)
MRIRWYGQSAFVLQAERTVFVDPFGNAGDRFSSRGLEWGYPAIEGVSADVLLITHEHFDHNAAEVIGGDPVTLRSTAGRLESPLGEVVAVASEHDTAAGTERGPNTIFCFALGGLRLCHFGDFGQSALRPEQRAAIGDVEVVFLPVGQGPTISVETAVEVVRALAPRLVVPMHYRTAAINFLEPPDAFLDALGAKVERLDGPELEPEALLGTPGAPVVALPAPPAG